MKFFRVFFTIAGLAGLAAAGGQMHWGYSGEAAPEHWAKVAPEFAICSSGLHQSPIDVVAAVPATRDPIELDYAGHTTEIVNNGHTIQVNVAPGSFLRAEGVDSELQQFHFHSPSEHQIGGEAFPLEVHFVHQSSDGMLSVVGVLFREADDSHVSSVWTDLPKENGETRSLEMTLESLAFVPNDLDHYRYSGSLTTPPCSEGVRWYLMKSHSAVSAVEVANFVGVVGQNARPVQPLNSRLVVD